MPANEFEKQVQNQLDGFQLNPSASVWEKVEKQIRERKRRRIVVFFLLPVALGLLTFSYFKFFYSTNTNKDIQHTVAEKKTVTPSNDGNAQAGSSSTTSQPNDNAATNHQPAQAGIDTDNTTNSTSTPNPTNGTTGNTVKSNQGTIAQEGINGNKKLVTPGNKTVKSNNVLFETATATPSASKSKNNKRPSETNNQVVIDTDAPAVVKKTESHKDKPVDTDQEDAVDKSSIVTTDPDLQNKKETKEEVITATEPAIAKKDSNKVAEVPAAGKVEKAIAESDNKWPKLRWGVDGSAGLSFNTSGTLTFAPAVAFDRLYNNGYGTPSNVGAGSAAAPVSPPSPIKQGPAFRFGLTAELQVSSKSRFSAGLQYAYSSNRISIGEAKDTSVTLQPSANVTETRVDLYKLYEGGGSGDKFNYTNAYHFVRMPLYYHLQLNEGKKLPVQWNVGMSLDYLVSTNALVYSSALGGIYYQDKNAFNKLHVTLGTGISFRLRAKNGGEWLVGPEASFDMNSLVKSHEKQYMLFTGIQAKWLFPKKKK